MHSIVPDPVPIAHELTPDVAWAHGLPPGFSQLYEPHVHIIKEDWSSQRKDQVANHIDDYHVRSALAV